MGFMVLTSLFSDERLIADLSGGEWFGKKRRSSTAVTALHGDELEGLCLEKRFPVVKGL
jgi:hypothetical protein